MSSLRSTSVFSAGEARSVEVLRVGDSISLFDSDHDGFLMGELTGHVASSLVVKPGTIDQPKAGNFKTCVLQVRPKSKYKANKKFSLAVDKLRKPGEKEYTVEKAIERGGAEIQELKDLAEAENEDNRFDYRRKHGDRIVYGQTVQLYHPLSDKSLCVSTTETSKHEPSHMRVDLHRLISRHSWFRIMPRYKVRAEGDPVRHNDQIVLESIKTPGQFIHASDRILGANSLEPGCFEINLSVSQTSFVIVEHQPMDADTSILKGGDVIQLFHKEISAYLAAEGSPDKTYEDVHLRIRLPDTRRPTRRQPPTSAVSFWQVECADNATSGRVIQWQDAIRLKHLTTQRYLCMSSSTGACSLVSVKNMDTQFSMEAVIQEQDTVQFGIYTRIQHLTSGSWLHAAADKKYSRQRSRASFAGSGDFQERVNRIPWDGANLVQLQSSEHQMFDDAFIVMQVPEEQVSNVAFVVGMIPPIRHHQLLRAERELTREEATRLVEAFGELRAFMYEDGFWKKTKQKLLRNLSVIELLIETITVSLEGAAGVPLKDINHPRHQHTREVCEAAYCVLDAYLEGNSRKNELYMAQHLPFFQSQIGHLGVECMYTELVRDNRLIIQAIGEKEVRDFIAILSTSKNPDCLEFLSVLCEAENGPIPNNQTLIANTLLKEAHGTVYLTEVKGTEVVVNTQGGEGPWIPLQTFAASALDEDDSTSTREFLFLQRQLELFDKLCAGRNEDAIDLITAELRYLTWQECFHCAKDEKLPKSLRAKYVSLMVNLFIDVGDNVDVLDETQLAYVWDDLIPHPYLDAAKDRAQSLSGARLEFFPELSDWILRVLNNQQSMVAIDRPANLLLGNVLELLHHLVSFGYYIAPDDIRSLMKPLRSLADGRNDVFSKDKVVSFSQEHNAEFREHWQRVTRFERNPHNEVVMNAKHQALLVIDSLMNLALTVRIQHLLFDFKQAFQGAKSAGEKGSVFGFNTGGRDSSVLESLMHADEEKDVLALTEQARAYLKALMGRSSWVTPNLRNNESLVHVFLDLSLYRNDHVMMTALRLTDRVFKYNSDLFTAGVNTQILVHEDSIKTSRFVNKQMFTLRRLAEGYIESGELNDFRDIMLSLIKRCCLKLSTGDTEAHAMNQRILVNAGLHFVCYDIISRDGQFSEVLSLCFTCLRVLARGNDVIQQSMFDHLSLILNCTGATSGWENDMANAVAEVFTGNHELCVGVKPDSVAKMMAVLSELTIAVPSMFLALRAVAKVEELNIPLKRNQSMIIKNLMERRGTIIRLALIDDESDKTLNAERLALLRSRSGDDQELREYHNGLVHLLAACAEGENQYIESMCQTVFSIDELFEVLLDDTVSFVSKEAYARFFLWVYINTADNGGKSSAAGLGDDPRLWQLVSSICALSPFASFQGRDRECTALFDAFLPLMTRLINKYYAANTDKAADMAMAKSAGVLNSFLAQNLSLIHVHAHIKALAGWGLSVSSKTEGVDQKRLQQLGARLTTGDAGLLGRPEVLQLEADLGEQTKLNVYFNKIVERLRAAYEGANTVAVQLASSSTPRQLAVKSYAEEEGSDEALPLGPEFQAHLGLFLQPTARDRTVSPFTVALARQLAVSPVYQSNLSGKALEQQTNTDITAMRLVRALVHNEMKCGRAAAPLQNQFAQLDIVLPLIYFLHNNDDNVVRETLACLAILLDEGNRKVQEQFEKYFLGTREEMFFADVQNRIRRSLGAITEMRILKRLSDDARVQQSALMGTLTMAKGMQDEIGMALGTMEDVKPRTRNSQQLADGLKATDEALAPELDLRIKDEGNITLVLRVLQNMCENQNEVLKAYLHHQPDNIRSVDLVAQTVEFLQVAAQEVNSDNIELLLQTMETLVEFAQGNRANQEVIFDAAVTEEVNYLLRLTTYPGCEDEMVARVKHACAKLLASMLEDNHEFTTRMAQELVETVDLATVRREMVRYYNISAEGADRKWVCSFDDDEDPVKAEDVAYMFYGVLVRLQDFTKHDYIHDKKLASGMLHEDDAIGHFDEQNVSIEIMRWGRLHKIHFQNKWKNLLRHEVKANLNWQVDRSSPTDKIRDFVDRSWTIIADIEHVRKTTQGNFVVRSLFKHSRFIGNVLLLLTIAINILLLINYETPNDDGYLPGARYSWFKPILIWLGVVHLVVSLLVAAAYYISNPPSLQATLQSIPWCSSLADRFEDDSPRTKRSLTSIAQLYHMAIVVFSVLGLLFDGYFFCFHLFHIVVNNDILLRVIQSVTKNGKSLLWVGALMFVVIYVYSFVTFALLRTKMEDGFCSTAFQCFISSLRLGLMSGGGLGEALSVEEDDFVKYAVRVVFDLSFFIIITIIALNVVFGIIVDTFSELRDEKYHVEELMGSECFICSLKNYDFERFGNGFQTHVKEEHCMWNYLHFLQHLKEKEATDYTSHEAYIANLLDQQLTTAFFPINQALALNNDAEESLAAKVDDLSTTVRALSDQFQRSLAALSGDRQFARQRTGAR